MTEPRHLVHTDDIDLDLSIALGLPVVADCGVTFVPRPEDVALALPKCVRCHYPRRKSGAGRGQHRTPTHIRSQFPHYVYRCYDAQDRLLYVGCTYNPPARMRQHRAENKPWISKVARTRLTVWPDRRKALDMERLAIETEAPIHNKQFNQEAS